MKKNLKLLVIGLLVAVAATLTCAFMPACGGNNDNGTAYTIKVVCAEDGFDYTQIKAQWCAVNQSNEIGACYGAPKSFDADGVATWDSLPDNFIDNQKGWHAQVNLYGLEGQYSYDTTSQSLYVTGPATVTITITKNN